MIDSQHITGLVLAGGRGSRMGGVDKGLQPYAGQPLVMHAVARLGAQVGPLMINANRNLGAYESFGVPVWPDTVPDYAGPLAGFLVGLEHCETPWLVTGPATRRCSPTTWWHAWPPLRWSTMPRSRWRPPAKTASCRCSRLFCLMKAELMESLVRFTQGGQRKIDKWTAQHRCVEVPFDDARAFANANTLDELRQLQPR